jgi:uncharacterized protein YecA (UPF0149 family)
MKNNPLSLEVIDPELDHLLKLYYSGRLKEWKELGRNDICWCGSNKKYKICHGKGR